jgi:hypothetical protein
MAARRLSVAGLLRPHRTVLAIAFAAMLVEAAVDILQPWPLKVIFDYVLGGRTPPPWLALSLRGAGNPLAILEIAASAVVVLAVIGAISSYTEFCISTACTSR